MDQDVFTVESLVLNESFQRYCLGNGEADIAYWEEWLKQNPGKTKEFFKAKELYSVLNGGNHALDFEKHKAVFHSRLVSEGILKENKEESRVVQMTDYSETKRKFPVYKLLVAASILGIIIIGSFFLLKNKNNENIAKVDNNRNQIIDKQPGGNKAILTLADGKTIVLDSTADGLISQQGDVKVINAGGLLSYQNGNENTEVVYNTISTPKGGQYQILLADGSKVWLNASSSLRFPSAFKGVDRNVELTGEGYFEIAHNASMPFHVKVDGLNISVLGTHFNVMAYKDEELVKTTLVEGKIKVQKDRAFVMLAPGQQAQLNVEGAIRLDKNADIEEAIAWKKGLFQFAGADMRTVMRHIGRWYNIETVLKGDMKNIHLSGKVSRNLNLSQIIQVLENSGIEIKMEGDKIIASPKP